MFSQSIAFLFQLTGWRIKGTAPFEVKKAIWVVIPHTSNFDFFIGLGTRAVLKMDIGYLAKKELFRWYSGWFFRKLGGYPVERKKATNLVDAVAKTFQEHDTIHIAIAPEGTRKDVKKLKSGFYYMALGAQVPIIPVCFNWTAQQVIIGNPLFPTGDFNTDVQKIYAFYLENSDVRKSWLQGENAN
tara:strand:- start:80 stop:637 length:558 start_codon:yes stop_codon:yes gene_type:complete